MQTINIEVDKSKCVGLVDGDTIRAGRLTDTDGGEEGVMIRTSIPDHEEIPFDSTTMGVVEDDREYGKALAIRFAEQFKESEYMSYMKVEKTPSGSLKVEGT